MRNRIGRNVAGRALASVRRAPNATTAAIAPARGEPAEQPRQAIRPSKKLPVNIAIATVAVFVLGLVSGGILWHIRAHSKTATLADSTSNFPALSIPTYYAQNLPAGYTYNNDPKKVKSTIMYFSVMGPNNQRFYVSQQPVPPNFDFNGFAKKFLNPTTFSSDAGLGAAGQLGNQLVGSIQTNKNTWIIINSPAANSLTELETVARSLEPTK